jgi:hypothetical protein
MTAERNAAELYQEEEALEPSDSTLKAVLGATLTLMALTILWEVLVRQFQVPAWLLPSPTLIAESMVEWRSELVGHSMVTLYETLVGFALSIAISVPLAVAVVYSPLLQNTIYPILLALQSMDRLWHAAKDRRGVPGLLLPDHRCDCDWSRRRPRPAHGPHPIFVGKLAADLCEGSLPDRHAAHLRRPQDRHHLRSDRGGDRGICRFRERTWLSHPGIDLAVAHSTRVRCPCLVDDHEHRALLRHRAR